MSTAKRPLALPEPWMSRAPAMAGILILAILAAVLAQQFPGRWEQIQAWALHDNDDAMRVLQVRDLLAGQGWYDPVQHRLNPPDGGDMHWSRLADLPLLLFMAPLVALFGQAGENMAAFAAPLALGLAYIWTGARATEALAGRPGFWVGAVLLAAAPGALNYFMPGRVDHHGLQIWLAATCLWGLFGGTARGGAMAGAAMAAGLCIGLEALPLQVAMIGWVALRWGLDGPAARGQAMGFGLGFAVSLALLFAATVPVSRWALPVNDAIGRGHVVAGLVGGCLLFLAAWRMPAAAVSARFLALVLVGALACVPALVLFPELLRHPYAAVDPMLRTLWLDVVNETRPLFRTRMSTMLAFGLFPALAAGLTLVSLFWLPAAARARWSLMAATLAMAAGLALCWQGRMAGLATGLAAMAFAGLLVSAWRHFKPGPVLIALALCNPLTAAFAGNLVARHFEPANRAYVTGGGAGCYRTAAFAALAGQPPGLVVAPIDMGARLMLVTPHQALAAPYHRNNRGNGAAYRLFMAPAEEARAGVAAFGGRYVAICRRSSEVLTLSRRAPGGLMADLISARAPAWLRPLPITPGSDISVWVVSPAPAPAAQE